MVKDCHWTDRSHVVAAIDHPLRRKRSLGFADLMGERWAVPVRGSEPYQQLEHALARGGLGMPESVVETRSVPVMKNLVAHSGFLSRMNEPITEVDRRAGLLDALPVRDAVTVRTLTAHRRRMGLLPARQRSCSTNCGCSPSNTDRQRRRPRPDEPCADRFAQATATSTTLQAVARSDCPSTSRRLAGSVTVNAGAPTATIRSWPASSATIFSPAWPEGSRQTGGDSPGSYSAAPSA